MQLLQQLFNSLSIQQLTLLLGIGTWLMHLLLNRYHVSRGVSEESRKALNNFFMRTMILLMPLAAAIAADPNVDSFVHDYLPALYGFFIGYQGFYKLGQLLWEKWQNLSQLFPELPAEDAPADDVAQSA